MSITIFKDKNYFPDKFDIKLNLKDYKHFSLCLFYYNILIEL